RVSRTRIELRLHRTKAQEARLSFALDCTHRRRRAPKWSELFAVNARIEAGGNRARSKDSGRLCRQAAGGFCWTGNAGQESFGGQASGASRSVIDLLCALHPDAETIC